MAKINFRDRIGTSETRAEKIILQKFFEVGKTQANAYFECAQRAAAIINTKGISWRKIF